MKFLIIFIQISLIFASDYELKLYEKVFSSLFHKNHINLYVDKNQNMFKHSNIIKLTNCKNADILLIYNLKNIKCKTKPLFTTSYVDYINSNSIGAFYWRKGRPQLVLKKEMIKKYNLFLDKSLQKYAR